MMLHEQSTYSYEDLLTLAKDGFIENGPKLPQPPMLMFDRITTINTEKTPNRVGYIEAEMDVRPDAWFFACHFHKDPVMPGCLGLDALWQLIGFFMGRNLKLAKGRALGCGNVTFRGEITPQNIKVVYQLDITKILERSKQTIVQADGIVVCDEQPIYKAQQLKVGLFA